MIFSTIRIFTQIFIFFPLFLIAQQSQKASKFFNKGDYEKALEYYLSAEDEELNANDNFRLGTCYFLADKEQTKGIKYLQKYINESDSVIPVANFYLASLYHKDFQFDQSINEAELFLEKLENELLNKNIDSETYQAFKKETENIISYCNYGKAMLLSPRNILVENLGDKINTKYQDYAPAISLDEKDFIFTSRRPIDEKTLKSDDGDFFEGIFSSELIKGSLNELVDHKKEAGFFNLVTDFEYTSAKRLPSIINNEDHNASIQLSNDATKLYFYRDSDVWFAEKNDTSWNEPQKMGVINSESFEPSVYITLDEKTMYITSEKDGGFGGLDIYVSEKDSLGNWSEMKNLGSKINTDADEDISYVNPKKDVIYFSSKGHSSMGGYDIFKSIKKNNEWSSPINMGSPINTPYDDAFFIMTTRYNRGYYASKRPEGLGGMDLYRLTFTDERVQLAELAGLVLKGDSLVPAKSKITMLENNSSLSTTQKSKEKTGEYLLLVEHGRTYDMLVETEGFAPYKKTFKIPEQIEYFQLYQEIHHVYLRDSEGNIIGQQIITHNAFEDIENEMRKDTLNQLFTKESYSKYVRDSSNSSVQKFIDVKFYITEDSLMSLLEKDKNLKFVFPDYAEISFLYNNNTEFRYALNSYATGKNIDLNYLRNNTLLVNELKDSKELAEAVEKNIAEKSTIGINKKIVVLFGYKDFNLSNKSVKELDILVDFMKENNQVKFLIKGFTDSMGSEEYNMQLSINRSKSVYTYLVNKGIDKERLSYEGFGENDPIAPNVKIDNTDNPEGRSLNRRVEFEMVI